MGRNVRSVVEQRKGAFDDVVASRECCAEGAVRSSDAVLTSKLEKALASLDDAMQEIGSEPRLLARASMTLPRADAVLFGSCSERDNFKVMGKVWKSVTVSLTKLSPNG